MVTFRLRMMFARRARNEQGVASFIWFLLMLPMMLGLFGLAVDIANAAFSASTLQSALDTATQSAVAQSNNPTNGANPTLSSNTALNTVRQYYALNRHKVFTLACQGQGGTPNPGAGSIVSSADPNGVSCPWVERNYTFKASTANGRNYISYSVTEYTHELFLEFLGIDFQRYDLTSVARLNQSTQN